jgi:hypothetical protein
MAAKLTAVTHKTAPSCRELYRLQFSLQTASPETFGYTFLWLLFVSLLNEPNHEDLSIIQQQRQQTSH